MSTITETVGKHERNAAQVLLKVQDDLLALREQIATDGDGGQFDLSSLENAIRKTQTAIREQTENVAHQLNNQVNVLPASAITQQRQEDTIYDLKSGKNAVPHLRHLPVKKLGSDLPPVQMAGPTPGEFAQKLKELKILRNPKNTATRDIVSKKYGVRLPLINNREGMDPGFDRIIKGPHNDALNVLPPANRHDPQLLPPPITEEDARHGIMSLMDRGLIPPGAELHLNPPPVLPYTLTLYNPTLKEEHRKNLYLDKNVFADGAKFDEQMSRGNEVERAGSGSLLPKREQQKQVAIIGPEAKSADTQDKGQSLTSRFQPMLPANSTGLAFKGLPPPTTPASTADIKDKLHRFAIQNGKVREQSSEFVAYKQHYCLSWGCIVTMIQHMEKFLQMYSVPIALIDGDKLADLALEYELRVPPHSRLMGVVLNRENVMNFINQPGRRYMGKTGQHLAAQKIQATFRMHRQRLVYLDYRRRQWAAGVIAIAWLMCVKMTRLRRQLHERRVSNLEAFRKRAKELAKRWGHVKNNKRVIIHVPSQGYAEDLRQTIDNMSIWQNSQMGRICDIRDPNVDVIYVSPVVVNEEMAQYYGKLMALQSAVMSGNVDDQVDLSDRFKIITPEATQSFPNHKMSLSTLLKYSSRTLKRIKSIIRGREAIMVTGLPQVDDLEVATLLNVPILCPDPDVAHLYSTKSGNKRIFASADVCIPPSEYDIYSINQLYEVMAQLIVENLQVTRWLLKLDTEFDGRGIAYLDVAENLPSFGWALKESVRYGEKWKKKWAQEGAFIKIHSELPSVLERHMVPCNTDVYKNYQEFIRAFISKGGIVEAYPPSDSVTDLTVDLFLEPNGDHSIISLGDQIHADSPFRCWGISFPQSSVEPALLNEACDKIAVACKTRGVVGYMSLDFVTFIHPKTMRQELWATDLSLTYSDHVGMVNMLKFMTAGIIDPKTHFYNIEPPKKDEKKSKKKRVTETDEPTEVQRYSVLSSRLYHSNLSVVHYSVFFQMCRAHGIGFDVKEKQGTVFTLVDSTERENLGMLTIADTLQVALAMFARNLSVVHQEISAPNMQGQSNFKAVIEDIEAILGTAEENEEAALPAQPSGHSTNN